MRIGIELRHVTLENPDGSGLYLKNLLSTLITRYPHHEYHVFDTIFNRDMLPPSPSVHHHSIPAARFRNQVDLVLDGLRLDALFRSGLAIDSPRFAMNRQVVFIPELPNEHHPGIPHADRRREFSESVDSILTGAGAIITRSAHTRELIRAHPASACRDLVVIAPPVDANTETTARHWIEAADSLHAAFGRVETGRYHTDKAPAALRAESAPLVSIVTPSFNQAVFLERTIHSVLNQTYPRIEYMVLDGGSRDGSADILRQFGDRFWWVSEPDGGQTAAINKGLGRAQGDIFAYLNSDDVLLPDAVERAVEFFLRHPTCDMVYGLADFIDADDGHLRPYPTQTYSFETLMDDCCVCQPAAFWRRRVTDAMGPFDEHLKFAMDFEYWLRMAKSGHEIRHVRELWAQSRLHDACKTMSGHLAVLQEIETVCLQHGGYVSPRYLTELARCQAEAGIHTPAQPSGDATTPWRQLPWKMAKRVARRIKRTLWPTPVEEPCQSLAPNEKTDQTPSLFRGIRGDNWLSPHCTFPIFKRPSGQSFYLAGTAALDLHVTIRYQGNPIWNGFLEAHVHRKIVPPIPANAEGVIEVEFSRCLFDPGMNPISFLLQETNLYSEWDYRAA